MVAAALLFGDLTYEMYEDDFGGIDRIEELRKNIFVQEDKILLKIIMNFQKDIYQIQLKFNIVMIQNQN